MGGQWVYWDRRTEGSKGPMDEKLLKHLLLHGRITPDTLIWQDGMDEWRSVHHEWTQYCQWSQQVWYYMDVATNVRKGPLRTLPLLELWSENEITNDTLIWSDLISEWTALGRCPC